MTHFIKLPNGTIINTALVIRVTRPIPNYVYIDTGKADQDNPSDCYDPTGAIYAYFDSIAEPIDKKLDDENSR